MKIQKMKDQKSLALTSLSFSELKTIKDACLIVGNNGAPAALKIGKEIEKLMETVAI